MTSFSIFAVIAGLRFIANEARYQNAKRRGNQWIFPVGLGLRWCLGIGTPVLAYASYRIFVDEGSFWLASAIMVLSVLGLLSVPPEIVVDEKGIHQKRLLGFRKKTIPWQGTAVGNAEGIQETLIIGQDGTAIMHTQYHVGKRRLLSLLKERGVFIQGPS